MPSYFSVKEEIFSNTPYVKNDMMFDTKFMLTKHHQFCY